jgi:hypothetical protein
VLRDPKAKVEDEIVRNEREASSRSSQRMPALSVELVDALAASDMRAVLVNHAFSLLPTLSVFVPDCLNSLSSLSPHSGVARAS